MTKQKQAEVYNRKNQQLINDIEKIISSALTKPQGSDEIMKRLREEYIYINKFESKFVTINPYSDDVKPELEDGDEEKIDNPFFKIFANSFGPFNSEEYFKDDTVKVLWLLKEPFIEEPSWEKGDRGGHDQASENRIWDEKEMADNLTLKNLIRRTQDILQIIRPKDNEYSEQEAMNHICILEVNHFPGLAFSSKDSNDKLIGEWALINAPLIKKLISVVYEPQIIIGGMTLGHFFPEGYRYKDNHNFDHISGGIENGTNMLEKLGYTNKCGEDDTINSGNFLFNTVEGCVFVDAYHPIIYSSEQAEKDAEIIKEWIK